MIAVIVGLPKRYEEYIENSNKEKLTIDKIRSKIEKLNQANKGPHMVFNTNKVQPKYCNVLHFN